MADVRKRFFMHLRAVGIAGLLNELPGPWQGRISIGQSRWRRGMIDLLAFSFSIESSVLSDPRVGALTDTEVAWLLNEYWGVLEEVWSEAFKRPEEYEIQSVIGVFSLHMLLPEILSWCQRQGGWSRAGVKRLVAGAGIGSEFWRTGGEAWRLRRAPRCTAGLVDHLRDRLHMACQADGS